MRTIRTAAQWRKVVKNGKFFDGSGLMEFWIMDKHKYKLCFALLPVREQAKLLAYITKGGKTA